MGNRKVPKLSFAKFQGGSSADKDSFSRDLFEGLKQYGFIVLADHGVNQKSLQTAYRLSQELFELGQKTKLKYDASSNHGQRGFVSFGKEHAKDAEVEDLKEFWHVGQDLARDHPFAKIYPANVWPEEIPDFKSIFTELYRSLENTGASLLRALVSPLGVSDDYFDNMTKSGNSILRLLHYPPIADGTDPRCVRAAEHEDINLITLLVTASAEGLQLKDRDGSWLDVEADPEDIIVDSGDMLARITNEVLPATTHRVVNPQGENTSRYSMPFFMHPHPEALLSCIESCRGDKVKYEDIRAQDFLEQRLQEIGLRS